MVDLRQATEADAELAYAIKVAAFRTYVELTWGWDEQVPAGLSRARLQTCECEDYH